MDIGKQSVRTSRGKTVNRYGARARLSDSYVLLYRGAGGVAQNQSAIRQQTLPWSLTDGVLFVGMHGRGIHTPGTLSVLWRFPVGSDAVRPESCYCGLDPVSSAWQRTIRDDAGQLKLLPDFPRAVFYDLYALDERRVDVFVSVDGQLAKWTFDGEKWQYDHGYQFRVIGPFLIVDGGKSIVAERDGKWSLIRGIERDEPDVRPLTERIEGEPLTLVEDKVEQKNFFLHRDRLLDDNGRELFIARASRDHTDRLRKVIDFVVSRRQPRP